MGTIPAKQAIVSRLQEIFKPLHPHLAADDDWLSAIAEACQIMSDHNLIPLVERLLSLSDADHVLDALLEIDIASQVIKRDPSVKIEYEPGDICTRPPDFRVTSSGKVFLIEIKQIWNITNEAFQVKLIRTIEEVFSRFPPYLIIFDWISEYLDYRNVREFVVWLKEKIDSVADGTNHLWPGYTDPLVKFSLFPKRNEEKGIKLGMRIMGGWVDIAHIREGISAYLRKAEGKLLGSKESDVCLLIINASEIWPHNEASFMADALYGQGGLFSHGNGLKTAGIVFLGLGNKYLSFGTSYDPVLFPNPDRKAGIASIQAILGVTKATGPRDLI